MSLSNRLVNETSPYLLQHAHNPVNWYPWGDEAFNKAASENKPIFLSIGYSTCHWCHVMERESFEDDEASEALNEGFIAIKVDKEERPDIDSIYMRVCQAMTGSGGWPLTVIMTPEKKPFFAGTYLPKHSRFNMTGLIELLAEVSLKWKKDREDIEKFADGITNFMKSQSGSNNNPSSSPEKIIEQAFKRLKNSFDEDFGGFGDAPKFPMPHNLLFLLQYYKITGDKAALKMSEKTLLQMYKGGIFDHIGFGFSRYSTDGRWLVPHFEKMLYDNALLIMAYSKAYQATNNSLYKNVAGKTVQYVLRELTSDNGGFYCAQDADSDGVEGKYYVFEPEEVIAILGDSDGKAFNQYYNIAPKGNFEGKSILNLIANNKIDAGMEKHLTKLYEYRKTRTKLHKDDKFLASWNGLMISALAQAYGVFEDAAYLKAAADAALFTENNLYDGQRLFASFRDGKRSHDGFIDDYAFYIYSLIELYNVTFKKQYLKKAEKLLDKAIEDFWDPERGGFFLYGKTGEQLLIRPKEVYDGAMPSGNSVMVYNLFMLSKLLKSRRLEDYAQKQIDFMTDQSQNYPEGYSFFMMALLLYLNPPKEIVCVLKDESEYNGIIKQLPKNAIVTILERETKEYPLKDLQTTFYICEHNRCMPPVNDLNVAALP